MKNLRHNQNVIIEGEDFTIVDLLQEKGYEFIKEWSNDRIFGRKRTLIISKEKNQDLDDWKGVVQLENLEKVFINGSRYMVVVKDINACEGVAFIKI